MVLERGILCGRRTYANMIKYVRMTVSSNFGNIFSVLVALLFLPFLPMTAVQLLLLSLAYDLTCTAHVPLVQSRACGLLLALGAVGIAGVTALPFSPLGAALDFCPLPAAYFALLACVMAGYGASVLLARRRYVRRHGELL